MSTVRWIPKGVQRFFIAKKQKIKEGRCAAVYLKVYRSIFLMGLSPNAMKIYLYLCQIQNCLHNAIVKTETVCSRCNIASRSTVFSALAELEEKGLICKYKRADRDGNQIANGYKVNALQGRWFLVPAEALELDKSSFAVFLFMSSCSNKKGRCFPSLTKMMAALHLACHTVIEAIRALVNLGLVVKGAFWPGRHNLYLVKLKQAKKEDADCNRRPSQDIVLKDNSFIIAACFGFVKQASSFFAGVLQKLYTSYKTHLKTTVKKKIA